MVCKFCICLIRVVGLCSGLTAADVFSIPHWICCDMSQLYIKLHFYCC
ncbi:hypothetical protein GLYMA_U031415v4 [Glycine max]|nr:hypothetical protein GLYMA_U031415v4 [Glycine max]KAH1043498.1 hypothetical protein GYH30_025373 [Glycine max]